MLTVTVDRPEGVNIDQCEQVSRALDPMLDEKEFDDMPSYTLCVSSAGMSRPPQAPGAISRRSWVRPSKSASTSR